MIYGPKLSADTTTIQMDFVLQFTDPLIQFKAIFSDRNMEEFEGWYLNQFARGNIVKNLIRDGIIELSDQSGTASFGNFNKSMPDLEEDSVNSRSVEPFQFPPVKIDDLLVSLNRFV